jgi:hypothetical protein
MTTTTQCRTLRLMGAMSRDRHGRNTGLWYDVLAQQMGEKTARAAEIARENPAAARLASRLRIDPLSSITIRQGFRDAYPVSGDLTPSERAMLSNRSLLDAVADFAATIREAARCKERVRSACEYVAHQRQGQGRRVLREGIRYGLPTNTPRERADVRVVRDALHVACRTLRVGRDFGVSSAIAGPGQEPSLERVGAGAETHWDLVVPRSWRRTVLAQGLASEVVQGFGLFVLSASPLWEPFTPAHVRLFRARVARNGRGYSIVTENVVLEQDTTTGWVSVRKQAKPLIVRRQAAKDAADEGSPAVDISDLLADLAA